MIMTKNLTPVIASSQDNLFLLAKVAVGVLAIAVVGMFIIQRSASQQPLAPPTSAVAEATSVPTPTQTPWAGTDIEIVKSHCRKGGFGHIGLWDVTLRNKSKTATWADLKYRTFYYAASGTLVQSERHTLYEMLRPGETKRFREINDGFINSQAQSCSFIVNGGETRP
jgi:hypothetical protein